MNRPTLVLASLIAAVVSTGVTLLLQVTTTAPVYVPSEETSAHEFDEVMQSLQDRIDRLERTLEVVRSAAALPVVRERKEIVTQPEGREIPDHGYVILREEIADLDRRLQSITDYLRTLDPSAVFAAKRTIAATKKKRPWGPEQAAGVPNTKGYGDHSSAWAPLSQDAGTEWLLLTYDPPVLATEVHVYETYNPGALVEITSVDASGRETPLWRGRDPTSRDEDGGVSKIPLTYGVRIAQLKLYLNTTLSKGWNEIDAVALVDGQGRAHWARSAVASSSYAERSGVASNVFTSGGVFNLQPSGR